jgi:hypothetical protein
VSSAPDADPFVQIRLSDLLALRAAASVIPELSPALQMVPQRPSADTRPPLPEYLTTKEAAALLGVTPKGLEAMRARGDGPAFIRVGRRVRYVASALGRAG